MEKGLNIDGANYDSDEAELHMVEEERETESASPVNDNAETGQQLKDKLLQMKCILLLAVIYTHSQDNLY